MSFVRFIFFFYSFLCFMEIAIGYENWIWLIHKSVNEKQYFVTNTVGTPLRKLNLPICKTMMVAKIKFMERMIEKERHRETLKMIIWNLYKVLTFEPMYNWQKHIFGNSGSIQSNNVVPSSNAFMFHTLVSWNQIEPPNEHTVKIDWIELDWNEMEWQQGQHILNKQSWKVALMKRNIYVHTHALSLSPFLSRTEMIGEIMSSTKVIMGLIFKGILA